MCWNACPVCLSACATLTTDREADRQVGQQLIVKSAASARAGCTSDGDGYIFHQLLRLRHKPGGVRDRTVASAAPAFAANMNIDTGSSKGGNAKRSELFSEPPVWMHQNLHLLHTDADISF